MLSNRELKEMVDIGIELTTEKDRNRLLEKFIAKSMQIANCDAGTLYLYKNDMLEFKIMKTLSQGVSRGERGEVIDLPPVPLIEGNVCAYAAIHQELVNIEDVYHSKRFDFSGPHKYDAITGYRTGSMIVIPMTDAENKLIGVLQLMNAMDAEGQIIPFSEDAEFVLRSFGSQAAVAVANMIYMDEIKQQMHSFVSAMATAVDERTPYNGRHTRKVTAYAGILADYINRKYRQGECSEFFDENRKEQLELASTLHDIGKMIVPLSVMNKSTRLDSHLEKIEERYKRIAAYYEIDYLKGRMSGENYQKACRELQEALERIRQADMAGFLQEEQRAAIRSIGEMCYRGEAGEELAYLTPYELKCLLIQKGTLTDEERAQMESHVIMTERILEKVHFNDNYKNVARFAASHHELLDGSGYPKHLKADEIELETRILAIVDVYDALTSTDRPYKKPMPQEKAFAILHSMAKEGKLEERLVTWLEEAMGEVLDKSKEQPEAEQ